METGYDLVVLRYARLFRFLYGRWKHAAEALTLFIEGCSDSSMDDGNPLRMLPKKPLRIVQIPLWTMETSPLPCSRPSLCVQIPLWTMET